MGCVQSCAIVTEESGQERGTGNDGNGKRQDKNRATTSMEKESNKEKSFKEGNKSSYLVQREVESSSTKGNKSKDVKQANASKDTYSKASPLVCIIFRLYISIKLQWGTYI